MSKALNLTGTSRAVLKSSFLDFNMTAYIGKVNHIPGINRSTGPSLTASPMHTAPAGESSEDEADARSFVSAHRAPPSRGARGI